MSEYIREYNFGDTPLEIKYYDKEPLKLTNEFGFFHNKISFRKDLNRLQDVMKKYLNIIIFPSAIRDSYLKEEYTEKLLILLFTEKETHRSASRIIEPHIDRTINQGCFYIESTSEYLLLLAKDKEGVSLGVILFESILAQTLEHYMEQKKFDDYIKIRPFELNSCKK